MEDYSQLDSAIKFQVLSRWFLTSLASAGTPSACDPEVANTLAVEPCQARPIAELLAMLDSSYFTEQEFLVSVQSLPIDADFRVKSINLQRVISFLLGWYEEVQNKTFTKAFQEKELCLPEHAKLMVEDKSDTHYRAQLLQLVLGVAVQNTEQLQLIMSLEAEDQAVVAAAINNLMAGQEERRSNEPSEGSDGGEGDFQTTPRRSKPKQLAMNDESSEQDSERRHGQLQKIHDLENTLQQVVEHKHQIEAENEQLQERLRAITNNEFFQAESEQFQQKLKSYQETMGELQEENYRLEILKDEYANKLTSMQEELQTIADDSKEKDMALEDVQMMQDELDYLREEAQRAATLEVALSNAKTKINDYDGLRQKFNSQNLAMQNLEEKLKLNKTTAAQRTDDREQINSLKNDNRLLQKKAEDEQSKREKVQFENKQLGETVNQTQAENQRLKSDLEVFQAGGNLSESLGAEMSVGRAQAESSEEIASLQTQLTFANDRIAQLESQHDDMMTKQNELQESKAAIEAKSDADAELKAQITQLNLRVEFLQKQNAGLTQSVEDATKKTQDVESQLQEKEAIVAQKEQDMRAMEKRYKTYLEKARSIIRQLDQRQRTPQATPEKVQEITKLKAALAQKSKVIEKLETEQKNSRQNRDDEERLIVNAWHRLTQASQFKTNQNSVINQSQSGGLSRNGSSNNAAGLSPKRASTDSSIQGSILNSGNTPAPNQMPAQSFLAKQRANANKRNYNQNNAHFQGNGDEPSEQKNKSWLMASWNYF